MKWLIGSSAVIPGGKKKEDCLGRFLSRNLSQHTLTLRCAVNVELL